MDKKLKILNLPFCPELSNKDANQKKVATLFKEHSDFEPDIVILPELWSTGLDYKNVATEAELIPGPTTMLLSGLAESYHTNIIAGSIFEKDFNNNYYNTSLIFDRNGAVISQYRKIHLFSSFNSQEKAMLNAGEKICTVELENVKIGIAICYDIRFPELFRKMVLDDVDIFVIPAAFPIERIEQWDILNQARALENLSILISCNQFGHSNLVSPYGEIIQQSVNSKPIELTVDCYNIHKIRKDTSFLNDIRLLKS